MWKAGKENKPPPSHCLFHQQLEKAEIGGFLSDLSFEHVIKFTLSVNLPAVGPVSVAEGCSLVSPSTAASLSQFIRLALAMLIWCGNVTEADEGGCGNVTEADEGGCGNVTEADEGGCGNVTEADEGGCEFVLLVAYRSL